MVKNTIYNIVKLITLTLLTVFIFTLFAFDGYLDRQNQFPEPDNFFKPFHAYTLEAYNKHIGRAQNLPNNFVSMDMLSEIGTFSVFYHNQHYGYISYDYELILENNYTVTLRISHEPKEFNPYASISATEIGENMLYLNSEKSAIYTSNNLVYRYIKGRLYSIEWTASGIWYDLYFPESFSGYPAFSPDSIVGKLTSKVPAVQRQALQQLPDTIGNVGLPLTVLHTLSQILPYAPLLIGIVAAALLRFLLAPRYRKEHEHPRFYANNFRNL